MNTTAGIDISLYKGTDFWQSKLVKNIEITSI